MTLEQKWDLIWPLACAVAASVERVDAVKPEDRPLAEFNLAHMCRQLKKVVDHISPDSSANTGGTDGR